MTHKLSINLYYSSIILLLLVELELHSLQFLCQEDILGLGFLPGDSQSLIFFLHVNEVGTDSTEFFFSLVDLIHIATRLEPTLFHKLCLVVRETVDLGLQVLDLILLFLIDCYLFCDVVFVLVLLAFHCLDLLLQALFVLLALSQLDLNVPQTLLELLNFRHRYT